MKKVILYLQALCLSLSVILPLSCKQKNTEVSKEGIDQLGLKRGEIITCGPPDQEFGALAVSFETSCGQTEDFNLAMALLHSFEYDEAEKIFARIIDAQPDCAMAYWGVAMSNFHPLWTPPAEPELKKGANAIALARKITQKTNRESDYIEAISAYYTDWDKLDHPTRSQKFEKAMQQLYTSYPTDKEAAIFYALALNAAADPSDKTLSKQKKAGSILQALYSKEPNHPGIVHYIIHTFDSPELADIGLAAARKYASVAPSSAHALHMPSHIFTRLGLWDESIKSNLASVSSAQCYAEASGIKGHWDEELHGIDYLMYAYLQKGDNELAKQQWEYLKTIKEVSPVNFKVLYAFAASPSRYVLENKLWKEAATLETQPANFPWEKFPWQKAIIHFARLLGNVHTGYIDSAKAELITLHQLHDNLLAQKDTYKANQVDIQQKAGEAWIKFKEGKQDKALELMQMAAEMEDKTKKHPVTPGEVIPARELLADLLLQLNKPELALQAYEADLKTHPNRFNGLYGAGMAAEKAGKPDKAGTYYRQLVSMASPAHSTRPELVSLKQYVQQ
ncbi:tetratricopeptide repeat protein [Rhodocytophaga rosea]|uniref:Tetratricopeptide repeat protein n=1 Tax=Rhodocytophaga rosea TaxID=2704465 RepID=A0A6C0GDH0_9BACT|nr:tetratricopeptide repeat protein [Rhodocytophaga rosea]QHT65802.1 tetratricopeptide repeat protein [Rhodocytophaga rosea]